MLDATITAVNEQTLERVGLLDIDDDELEQLLGQLEQTLILDRHDLWHLAGKSSPSVPPNDDDQAYLLNYAVFPCVIRLTCILLMAFRAIEDVGLECNLSIDYNLAITRF